MASENGTGTGSGQGRPYRGWAGAGGAARRRCMTIYYVCTWYYEYGALCPPAPARRMWGCGLVYAASDHGSGAGKRSVFILTEQ
jgi:hypothetical protein